MALIVMKLYKTLGPVLLLLFLFKQLQGQQIPIGMMLNEGSDIADKALSDYTNDDKTPNIHMVKLNVDLTDSFSILKNVCSLVNSNVFALLGETQINTEQTLQSITNDFRMPYVSTGITIIKVQHQYVIYMRPFYTPALLDVIKYKHWRTITYLFLGYDGLIRMDQLFQSVQSDGYDMKINAIEVEDTTHAETVIRNLAKNKSHRIVLDMNIRDTEELFHSLAQKSLLGVQVEILLASLGIDEIEINSLRGGGQHINVTGLSLVNQTETSVKDAAAYFNMDKLKHEHALLLDSLTLLSKAFESMFRTLDLSDYDNYLHGPTGDSVDCATNTNYTWEHGATIYNYIKKTQFQGLTGLVAFDRYGFRKKYQLDVLELNRLHDLGKIAVWSENGIQKQYHKKMQMKPFPRNRKLIFTTILEPPYVMLKASHGEILTGNDRFEGFCVDLISEMAKGLGLGNNYNIELVKDGKYGSIDENGMWNGMIGELVRQEADMAVAPLTISYLREEVVDFTKPFLSVGIGAIMKRPAISQSTDVFSFLDPFPMEVWMGLGMSIIVVSLVLLLITWFQPSEKIAYKTVGGGVYVTHRFTFLNAIWFTLAGLTIQNCHNHPRSIAGRILSATLWMFSLLFVCTYISCLIMFKNTRLEEHPVKTLNDLAEQRHMQYGCIYKGSTYDFFRNSNVNIYERMWNQMYSSSPSAFEKTTARGIDRVRQGSYAFITETTTIDYITSRSCDTIKLEGISSPRGYGIATPIGSSLKDVVNLQLLILKDIGKLQKLYHKWWYENGTCSSEDLHKRNSKNYPHAMSLGSMGTFYIVLIGLAVAIITVAFEFIIKSAIDARTRKITFKEAAKFNLSLAIKGKPNESPQEEIILDEQKLKA